MTDGESRRVNGGRAKPDWTVLPWPLMGTGLVLCALALALTRVSETEPELGRLLLLTGGLLCAGIGLTIRLNTTGPAILERVAALHGLPCCSRSPACSRSWC